jgi:hypothetical protein
MAEKNVYIAKTNFTGGQWSPELAGRVDLPQFQNAVLEMTNFLPMPRGGVRVRPGSVFVSSVKFPDKDTRLVAFEFNEDQTYILEFGDGYIRFFANNSRLEHPAKAITNVVDSTAEEAQVRVTVAGHGYSDGEYIAIRNVIGVHTANGDWEIANVTTDTFDLVGSEFVGEYASGGTASEIIEITSPYIDEDVFTLKTTQSADTMYIFHQYYPTYKLTRTAATTFTLEEVDWLTTPFLPINVSATTLDPDGNTSKGSVNVVAASTAIFDNGHAGAYFRIFPNGVVKVQDVINSTHVNTVIYADLPNGAATLNWAEGAWSDVRGFPGAGVFYENRLYAGGSLEEPQTVWGSKSGEYEDFTMTNTADNFALQYELASKQANIIRWMVGDDLLLIGTSGREFKMTGGNDSGITPTNVLARPQSRHGSKNIESVETTSGVVFAQRTGTKLRLMSYSLDKDRYTASDLTVVSNQILNNGVIDMAYQAEPNETIWNVVGDGSIRSLTLLSDQNVLGWAVQRTDGEYHSVETIKTPTIDQTWIIVDRTIGVTERRYVEYFDPDIALDCAVKQTFGDPVTSIVTGLAHLEGEEVKILGDGAVYPPQIVTTGGFVQEFNPSLTSIIVGLPFTPRMEFFKPDRELPDGHTTSRPTKVVSVVLLVDNALGFNVNGEINPVRSTSDIMDIPIIPGSEAIEFTLDIDWNEHVIITQHLPLPGQILAAFMYVEIGGD